MDQFIHLTPHFQIAQIGSESFDAAFDLAKRFFHEEGFKAPAEMRAALNTMIAGPFSAVFLARRGSQAVGIATVSTSVGLEYGRSAEMDDLYILPEARGQGIASALIETVCGWCEAQGCSVLLVTVTPQGEARHGLIQFYEKRSFIDTNRVILERSLHKEHLD